MVTRCCGFHYGFSLKVSSVSAIMLTLLIRGIQLIGYEINQTWSRDVVVFTKVLFLKVSSVSAIVPTMLIRDIRLIGYEILF